MALPVLRREISPSTALSAYLRGTALKLRRRRQPRDGGLAKTKYIPVASRLHSARAAQHQEGYFAFEFLKAFPAH